MRIGVVVASTLTACSIFTAIPEHEPDADGQLDCTTITASAIIDTTIAASLVSTAVYLFAFKSHSINTTLVGSPMAVTGALFAGASFSGWVNRAGCHRANREAAAAMAVAAARRHDEQLAQQRELRAHQEASSTAWKLAKQGETAAANGDCGTAAMLGERIRNLDGQTYAFEYRSNAAVAGCLATSSSAR